MTTFYVSGDIEGMSGYKQNPEPGENDRILHAHYIAAAEGLREGGAGKILLKSMHGVPGEYPDYVTPIRKVIPSEFDLPGIDAAKADGLVLVGFHGIPPHCGWGHAYRFSNLVLNGKRIGETTIEVYRAAVAGVPTVLFAGDSHAAEELREISPEAVVVVLRPGSLNLDEGPLDDKMLSALRDGAKKAAGLAAAGKVPVPKMPAMFRLEVPLPAFRTEAPLAAEAAAITPRVLPYPVVVEGNRVSYESEDFLEVHRFFQDMFNFAGAFRRLDAARTGK